MRAILRASIGLVVVGVLSGCTAAGTSGGSAPLPGAAAGQGALAKKGGGILYVDDGGNHAVEMFNNGGWKKAGRITSGIGDVDRNWVDAQGNFYVAQFSPVQIVEYAPGGSTPLFTYDNRMQLPVDVTTDTAGNVYEADELTSSVNEYAQQTNLASASCASASALVLSDAVDGNGDVFVGVETGGSGRIMEYSGGLNGCHATELGVTLNFPGGMALDNSGNIVICDEGNNTVDIIPPPYDKISGTLGSGYVWPLSVRINTKNDRAYVVDEGPPSDVFILDYPSGSLIKTLTSKNGVSGAMSAVDSANFSP
jgi:NHL repeat